MLEERGIITHKGTIVDATFVDAPRQLNSRDENEKIKNGEIPEKWKKNPHKMAQKDVDARWTKKRDYVPRNDLPSLQEDRGAVRQTGLRLL